jgi:hypothetical protein
MSISKKLLQAAAGNAGESLYVEDVFSTYLYEGSGAARTIDNNIALSDEGGLVWLKQRALDSHVLFDTVNGPEASLSSNSTDASSNYSSYLSFPSAGTTGWNLSGAILNGTGTTWASWTFRKAEKFFDVVTYTGTGTAQTIAHNLGVAPAVVIVKAAAGTNAGIEFWAVYHASLGATKLIRLNTTDAAVTSNSLWNDTAPTDTHFTVNNNGAVNNTGLTYVAYLFASDAGGFGDDGSENIIKCGSFTTDGSGNATVNLGYEPQWFLRKRTDLAGNWTLVDSMRGFTADGINSFLYPNLSNAEASSGGSERLTSTGVQITGFGTGQTYIYIAIRRPMKTPESGTEVFTAVSASTDPYPITVTSGFPVDMVIMGDLPTTWGYNWSVLDRLRGGSNVLFTSSTVAENATSNTTFDSNTGLTNGWVSGGTTGIFQMFKRATGFFDVVAYTGDGLSGHTLNHNLGVAPELIIIKDRDAVTGWYVGVNFGVSAFDQLQLQSTDAAISRAYSHGIDAKPTADLFSVGVNTFTNASSDTYIAYLFATLAGVSKVGSYTGTGADLNVDCGFSAGARFILIKRTDSTGDWYVWDSARGIVAGNDPYLLLNSTAAEVTSTDYIDPLSSGFTVTSTAPAALNASGGTYIFLAIA